MRDCWHIANSTNPRVGFIVTNMNHPTERIVAFYNKRGTCEQWIKEGKGAIKWARLSCRTFAPTPSGSSFMRSRTISAIPTDAGDARADQRLVADELEGEADQDRREGGEQWPLRRLPDGGSRHPPANVPRDFAADCGTTAATTASASVRHSSLRSQAIDRRSAPKCQGKWPDQLPNHRSGCPL
jgi:hypothetical protein